MHYAVAQRTREIGIRMALGAQAWDVLRMILRQGARPAAIGLGAGLAGSLIVTRIFSRLLFQVNPAIPSPSRSSRRSWLQSRTCLPRAAGARRGSIRRRAA
jgi:ABC-type antimicrobial peptide transport system permease subunit